jgi:uncharacterized protein (TIGR02646 family)
MIKLNRIKLKELGELGNCIVTDPALAGLNATGKELLTFLNDYVAAHPESDGWPQWKNRKTNHILFAILVHQTQDHCSMCDGYKMKDAMTAETIEHFRPKAGDHGRPDLRLTWENLFACCSGCQSAKGSQWNEHLLKPDDADYEFSRYFSCEFTTGKIVPKRRNPLILKKRAAETIRIYKLDRHRDVRSDMVLHDPYYGPTVPTDKKPFRYWVVELEQARAQRETINNSAALETPKGAYDQMGSTPPS